MEYPLLPIPGWEGLYATRGDKIISLRSGKELTPELGGPLRRQYYIVNLCRPGCKPKRMYIHRAILSANLGRHIAKGSVVDHIDNNPLNNDPNNLRETTIKKNTQTGYDLKRAVGNTSTNHKGVSRHRAGYQVRVDIDGISLYVGYSTYFDTACRIADDAFAGILTTAAKIRLEKLKEKKK